MTYKIILHAEQGNGEKIFEFLCLYVYPYLYISNLNTLTGTQNENTFPLLKSNLIKSEPFTLT